MSLDHQAAAAMAGIVLIVACAPSPTAEEVPETTPHVIDFGGRLEGTAEPVCRKFQPPDDSPTFFDDSSLPRIDVMDVMKSFREHRDEFASCVGDAVAAGALSPGDHAFWVGWTIAPSGRVSEACIGGVKSEWLVDCLVSKMRAWTFRATNTWTMLRNFPVGAIRATGASPAVFGPELNGFDIRLP